MKRRNRVLAVGFFMMALITVGCSAQQGSSFEQLQLLVRPGDNIYVTDRTGVTTQGRIAELSPSTLGLSQMGFDAIFCKATLLRSGSASRFSEEWSADWRSCGGRPRSYDLCRRVPERRLSGGVCACGPWHVRGNWSGDRRRYRRDDSGKTNHFSQRQ